MANSQTEAIDKLSQLKRDFTQEIHKVVIGQEDAIDQILLTIFSGGHALLLGVPGLAKTMLVQTIARILGLNYKRIQFTPDLMPSDIIGTEILDENRKFKFIKGPIFANVILADEINRTPPKTQSALLEAMQEKAVTVAGQTYKLQEPFFVLATQNPIEQEGTYPLPEAQLDRFMFNIVMGYPTVVEEEQIAASVSHGNIELKKLISAEDILFYQHLIREEIPVAQNIISYAVRLVASTRPNNPEAPEITKTYINWGAGPRASQFLVLAAKANAALSGKYSPDIEDVQKVAVPILRHRIIKNYKAEAEGLTTEKIIEQLMKS